MVASATETENELEPGLMPGEPQKTRKMPYKASLMQRAKAKSLYVVEQLSWKEISERTGLGVKSLRNMAQWEKWTATKKRVSQAVSVELPAKIREHVDEVIEGVAVSTESLSLETLVAAGEVLEKKSGDFWAKDLASLSTAAKNFIGLARQARGLDNANLAGENQQTLVFVSLDRIQSVVGPREEKVVTEIHELDTSEVKALSPTKDNAIDTPIDTDDGAF